MFPSAFARFLAEAPLCVMARVAVENLFRPERLDTLFSTVACRQYVRKVRFSQVVELMMAVVLRLDGSVLAAWRRRREVLGFSEQAVYDKLAGMELGVSAALVTDAAEQCKAALEALDARHSPWLPGFRARILDGNLLSKTQGRLREHRATWAAALPGRVLAVYDPEFDLVTDVFLTPDAHAQERTLADDVLAAVKERDLWIADRNFCTMKLLFGIADADARFVIRQHAKLNGSPSGSVRDEGRADTGSVREQDLDLQWQGRTLRVRRVTLTLDAPTRDGDREIHILTNLGKEEAAAAKTAELYRERWSIEGRFYEMAQTLGGEPETLAYPRAALFAFCLALAASNAMALTRAALRRQHGAEAIKGMSRHYMAEETTRTYAGMMVALPPHRWARLRGLSPTQLAVTLLEAATHVAPANYRKSKRGPKKPPSPKSTYRNGGHVSTHRLLEQRKLTKK